MMKFPSALRTTVLKLIVLVVAAGIAATMHLVVLPAPQPAPTAPQPDGISSPQLLEAARKFTEFTVARPYSFNDRISGTRLVDDSDATVGYVIDTTSLPGLATGYNGKVPVAIVLDADGLVAGIAPLANLETPSYMDIVESSGFLDVLKGRTIAQALTSTDVDSVSGATFTSQAMISATRAGLAAAGDFEPARGPDIKILLSQVLVAVALLLALACFATSEKLRRLRPLLLISNVLILGVLGGTMLSTALFASWIAGGPNLGRPLLVIAALMSIVLPFVTGRQFWCAFACPFGSACELASRIPARRVPLPRAARAALDIAGSIFLLSIPAILILKPTFDLSLLEPFPAFSLLAAPLVPVVIAAVFLVASVFVPKVWCRFLCPTGRVVNFFTTGGKIFDPPVKN
ncbi:MAG TPA: 4Fe-4S binding protein [Myxococcota bacterium]|nr:4Fe-4S binding protein [Myxococcota bacterium]